jgi:MoaA/NifB/PqqE/SkfB family radical SAM enzyme
MSQSGIPVSAPSHIQVKPTSICNLRCRTCSLWEKDIESGPGADPTARRLSDDELESLVNDFAAWGVKRLEFADGEPFLRRGTPQLIKQAASLGLDTLAISNATLIDRALAARLVNGGLNTLIVSLDGPKALHDEIRGVGGTFDKLSRAVRLINEEKERAGRPSPILIFHTVVCRLNIRVLEEVLETAASLGAAVAAFRYLSQVPPEAVTLTNELLQGEHASPAHHYTVEEDLGIPAGELGDLGGILDRLVQAGNRLPVQLALDPLLFDLAREKKHVPRRFEGPGCPLVGDFLQISPRGRVHPCPMLTGCGLGSVRERSVREIYEAPESQELLRRIQELFPLPICPHCCYREK